MDSSIDIDAPGYGDGGRASAEPLDARTIAKEIEAEAPSLDLEQPVDQSALPEPAARPRRRRLLRATLMTAGVLAVAVGSLVFWLRGGRYATTSDAYVEAAELIVTTDVSGLVSKVDVHEGEAVKAGQPLFEVDPRRYRIALAQAEANLGEVALTVDAMKTDYQVMVNNVAAQKAQVSLDQITNDRDAALLKTNNLAQAVYDQVHYALQLDRQKLASLQNQAREQLAKLGGNPDIPVKQHPLYLAAQARVDEARRELDRATVHAPFAGVVTHVDDLQPGTDLVAQTAALTQTGAVALVSTSHLWVTAQMKETALTYVKPGEPVTLTVDTYPGRVWKGHVQSVSPASSAQFSVLPPENASGNWVKVVQRIPVRISIDPQPGAPVLRSGMSTYVSIDTRHHRSLSDLF